MKTIVKKGINKAITKTNTSKEIPKVICCGNGCTYCVLDFKIDNKDLKNNKNIYKHKDGKVSK